MKMDIKLERIKKIVYEHRKLRKLETEVIEKSQKNCNNLDDLRGLSIKNAVDMKFCEKKLQDLENRNKSLHKLLAQKQQEMKILRETNQGLVNMLKRKSTEIKDKHKQYLLQIDRLRLIKRMSGVYLKRKSHPNKIEGVYWPTGQDHDVWQPFSLENSSGNNISVQNKFYQCIGYSENLNEWKRLIVPQFTDEPPSKTLAPNQNYRNI